MCYVRIALFFVFLVEAASICNDIEDTLGDNDDSDVFIDQNNLHDSDIDIILFLYGGDLHSEQLDAEVANNHITCRDNVSLYDNNGCVVTDVL